MDKLYMTGRNLGRVFNSRSGRMLVVLVNGFEAYTTYLKIENSAQATFGFSPVSCHGSRCWLFPFFACKTYLRIF